MLCCTLTTQTIHSQLKDKSLVLEINKLTTAGFIKYFGDLVLGTKLPKTVDIIIYIFKIKNFAFFENLFTGCRKEIRQDSDFQEFMILINFLFFH